MIKTSSPDINKAIENMQALQKMSLEYQNRASQICRNCDTLQSQVDSFVKSAQGTPVKEGFLQKLKTVLK